MIKTKLSVIILIAGAFLLSCGKKHSKDNQVILQKKYNKGRWT